MRTITDPLFATRMKPHLRWLTAWASIGAAIHACVPALHGAMTPFGPVALWLWLLPTAAIGLDLLTARENRTTVEAMTSLPIRRRRTGATRRSGVIRRDRTLSGPRPAARPVRQAG